MTKTSQNNTSHQNRPQNNTSQNNTSHNSAPQNSTSHNITSHHNTSHDNTSHHMTSHNNAPQNNTSQNNTSQNSAPQNSTSHHNTSHHNTSHGNTSHHMTSHNNAPQNKYITRTLHHITVHHRLRVVRTVMAASMCFVRSCTLQLHDVTLCFVIFGCKTYCSGCMTVAWDLCWGGSRSAKHCVCSRRWKAARVWGGDHHLDRWVSSLYVIFLRAGEGIKV